MNGLKVVTTIKQSPQHTDQLNIFAGDDKLIATAKKEDNGEYLVSIYGGPAHGKLTRAIDFQHLNDKSVEIANLSRV